MKTHETHRYIYKIICLCGIWKNKYYIGQHTTTNMDDGYAGSGVKISEYYSIYGKREGKTYKKEILSLDKAKNQIQLDKLEKKYIGTKYITDPLCLNMIEG